MIVLDTNIISETMRDRPEPRIITWLDELDRENVCLTAITTGELVAGAELLHDGQRRERLLQNIRRVLEAFDHIESFDVAASYEYARVVAKRRRLGRPIATADAQIAGICLALDAALATRNIKDFDELGIVLINPWEG